MQMFYCATPQAPHRHFVPQQTCLGGCHSLREGEIRRARAKIVDAEGNELIGMWVDEDIVM